VDRASNSPVTTIKVGGTITWTVTGDHSLEKVNGNAENGCDSFDPAFIFDTEFEDGNTVKRTFNKVGTFGYMCGVHRGEPNCKTTPGTGRMPGIIKVVP